MKRTKFLMLVAVAIVAMLPMKAVTNESLSVESPFFVTFNVAGIDPDNHDGPRRGPVVPPSVSIDGHTLYLYSGCAGATLQVVDALGVAVYTEELYETTTEVELPETLVGEYELQILRGNFCFYATIEL